MHDTAIHHAQILDLFEGLEVETMQTHHEALSFADEILGFVAVDGQGLTSLFSPRS